MIKYICKPQIMTNNDKKDIMYNLSKNMIYYLSFSYCSKTRNTVIQ